MAAYRWMVEWVALDDVVVDRSDGTFGGKEMKFERGDQEM